MDNIVLTEKGLALRDKLNAGQTTATFTRFCTSSAEYDQSELGVLTELKDSKLESAVTNLEIREDHTMVISGAVDNKSLQEGYYITLIGLYAKETDGEEILFAVSKVSSPMYMPEKSGALSGMSIRFSVKIENSDSINVTVDPTTAATLGDLNALRSEVTTPTFEDYESEESPALPALEDAMKQIKSGNTMRVILQNTKAAFKGLLNLVNAKVNQKDYDAAVSKLNGDISKKADVNHTHDLGDMINTLSIGASTPEDADYFISQYVGGGTQTVTYHRRPVSALWTYIKKKADSIYETKVRKIGRKSFASKYGLTLYYAMYGTIAVVNVIGSLSEQVSFSAGTGIILGTLPGEARPSTILFFPLNYLNADTDKSMILSVNSNGQVSIATTTAATVTIPKGRYINGTACYI